MQTAERTETTTQLPGILRLIKHSGHLVFIKREVQTFSADWLV